MMSEVFLLQAVISPYDGAEFIGIYESLEKAVEGRQEFRKHYVEKYRSDFESYEIYSFTLGETIFDGINKRPVDVFVPGKTKR